MSNRGMRMLVAMALLFVGAVVAWLMSGGISHTTTHTTTRTHEHTTVFIEPLTTPLRDSGPKNNPRTRTAHRSGLSGAGARAAVPQVSTTGARNRPLSTPKAKRPKTTHKPSGGAQKPNPAPQPPSPQPKPPVDVTVPAPVTVCVRPVGGVNCG